MLYTKLSLTADANNTLKQGKWLIRNTARDIKAVLGVVAHV